jgi:hypothetical protein
MGSVTFSYRRLKLYFRECLSIYSILKRRHQLRGLMKWAKSKRLNNPYRLYENRWIDEEIRLHRYAVTYPQLTLILRWLFWLGHQLLPYNRHYSKGAASQYRTMNLTPRHIKTYSYT